MSSTTNAWDALDHEHHIRTRLEANEIVTLSATQIRRHREPRLMTKFDTREERPSLLSGATILPVRNGKYVLLRGDGYHDVCDATEQRRWAIPAQAAALTTLPWWESVQSEAQALDMALASGMLGNFLEEQRLKLTIRGRRGSPEFAFVFDGASGPCEIDVEGVQIEVDAGLENNAIHLIEAKLGKRTNFHVRQLYYPLCMWRTLVPTKRVTTSLLTWHDRVFSLRRFDFDPESRYHGIRLAASIDYTFDDEPLPPSLEEILSDSSLRPAPAVPFPQADDVDKIIDLVDAVGAGVSNPEDLAMRYAFVERQAQYYVGAARFLGLVQGGYTLAEEGRSFIRAKRGERHRILLRQMASLAAFRSAFEWMNSHGAIPSLDDASSWVSAAAPSLASRTVERRAWTLLAWSRWSFSATRRAAFR